MSLSHAPISPSLKDQVRKLLASRGEMTTVEVAKAIPELAPGRAWSVRDAAARATQILRSLPQTKSSTNRDGITTWRFLEINLNQKERFILETLLLDPDLTAQEIADRAIAGNLLIQGNKASQAIAAVISFLVKKDLVQITGERTVRRNRVKLYGLTPAGADVLRPETPAPSIQIEKTEPEPTAEPESALEPQPEANADTPEPAPSEWATAFQPPEPAPPPEPIEALEWEPEPNSLEPAAGSPLRPQRIQESDPKDSANVAISIHGLPNKIAGLMLMTAAEHLIHSVA